jgi:thiol:disulfide interchange protein/DsbC/DsbD-like thiol-disulfide interchange protein
VFEGLAEPRERHRGESQHAVHCTRSLARTRDSRGTLKERLGPAHAGGSTGPANSFLLVATQMIRLSLAALVLALLPMPGFAAPVVKPHVQVELVSEEATIQPARDTSLGLRFVPERGWHVYWRNPGDSGQAPSVEWTLPPGFQIGELEWPAPERIAVGPLTNFGYAGATLLPARLRVPRDVAGAATIELRARAKWLVCNPEECIPGSAPLSLTLPVDTAPPRTTSAAPLFDRARAALPVALPAAWQLDAIASGTDVLTLHVRGLDQPFAPAPVFFPFGREVIEHSASQTVTLAPDGFQLALTQWSGATTPPRTIDGVLTIGSRAYTIAAPVVATGVAPHRARAALMPLLLAFAGGLLLNLMPCVFPVLALKALALVGLAGEGRRRARWHGLVYALGVIVAFWMLAGMLLAARAGGMQLGWGFHLQSPIVIALLASLFFWMALTLLGVSTVGASLMGVGNRLTAGGGYRAAFYAGVLATVVATPCTAPFMGTAIGYALLQPTAVALGVFTSLGIGLALPYVLVTFVPALARRLPRPGRWMETLEQLLAFPLLATVVWLVWVASLQAGPNAVLAILTALVLIGLAAWTAQRWDGWWMRVAAALLVVAALGIDATLASRSDRPVAGTAAMAWEPYSPARLDELLRAGKPVFVDFTAAWCVTCQVNERLALSTSAVTAKMRALGVVAVRADWTSPDPEIARALRQFGRDGVPLYVLYSGRREDPPRILPQILTTETVLTELAELETRSRT